MKQIYLTLISLVLMVTVLSLSSCSKSDDDNAGIIPADTYIDHSVPVIM